jgi:hypothetical protein
MAAGITLFQIKLPWLGMLSAQRLFSGQEFPYELEASASPEFWSMAPRDAVNVVRAAGLIDFRFRYAAKTGEPIKVGPVFVRKTSDGKLIFELGVVDDVSIYLQFVSLPKVTLRGEQARELLDALHLLGEDARHPGRLCRFAARPRWPQRCIEVSLRSRFRQFPHNGRRGTTIKNSEKRRHSQCLRFGRPGGGSGFGSTREKPYLRPTAKISSACSSAVSGAFSSCCWCSAMRPSKVFSLNAISDGGSRRSGVLWARPAPN